MRFDDIAAWEFLWPSDVAPDGAVAARANTASGTLLASGSPVKAKRRRGQDIMVHLPGEDGFINLTREIPDAWEWRLPKWSPDGQRLVMSTKDEDARIYIWERGTRTVKSLARFDWDRQYYEWLDATHLLAAVLSGEQQAVPQLRDPRSLMMAGWRAQAEGERPSVSVLNAGIQSASATPTVHRRRLDLMLFDMETGARKSISESYVPAAGETWGPHILRPPSGPAIAIRQQVSESAPSVRTWDRWAGVQAIELRFIDGRQVVLDKPLPEDVVALTCRWSSDGGELAFLAYDSPSTNVATLWRVDVRRGTLTSYALPNSLDLTPELVKNKYGIQIEWVTNTELMILGSTSSEVLGDGGHTRRRDWLLLTSEGVVHNLTAHLRTVPVSHGTWHTLAGGTTLVGLADGLPWKIDGRSRKLERLGTTPCGLSRVKKIEWSRWDSPIVIVSETQRTPSKLVDSYCIINVRSGAASAVKKPKPEAVLGGYAPESDTAVYRVSEQIGEGVWQSDTAGARSKQLIALNTFVAELAEGEIITVDYTSLNGEPLQAHALLPLGYIKGRRYPMITRVYPSMRAQMPCRVSEECRFYYDQFLSAAGYVLLYPSMPPFDEQITEGRDPLLQLSDGVLPAVDKLIAMGIADPDRLLLTGFSAGGFATYGLIGLVDRFKAAVPFAGPANYISSFGEFSISSRYTESSQQGSIVQEQGLRNGLEVPPSQDLAKYIRNSPLFYAHRVRTPVLIIQGDMDSVSMTQGEQFYSALQRLGKRVQFARYWGEGHAITGLANVRDVLQRMFAWFDEFGDISRDARGNMIFDGERVRSRGTEKPLKPELYGVFDLFQPPPRASGSVRAR